MNYHAMSSGCHFPAWQMEWCPGPAWFPRHLLQAALRPEGRQEPSLLFSTWNPPVLSECDQTQQSLGIFRVRGFSPQWFPPSYWKHFEEGAIELFRNQGQSPVIAAVVKSRQIKWTWWWYDTQEQKSLLYHLSGCPQSEKCSLFSSPMDSPSSLWALPVDEKQDTDIYLKCVC